MMEEESKSLSHSLLIFAVVIQSCHIMPQDKKLLSHQICLEETLMTAKRGRMVSYYHWSVVL